MENNRVIDHLQTLNAVFAQANPMHPERAEHAHKVLDFMLAEEPAQADALSLIYCAERLFLLHFEAEQNNHMAFAHLHVPAVEILSPCGCARHCSPNCGNCRDASVPYSLFRAYVRPLRPKVRIGRSSGRLSLNVRVHGWKTKP